MFRNRIWASVAVLIVATVVIEAGIGLYLSGGEEEGKVSVTVGNPTDTTFFGGHRSAIKVRLEGENRTYDIELDGPGGHTVGRATVYEGQMADGVQSTFVPMTFYFGITPKSGQYTLTVKDDTGSTLYNENFIYSRAEPLVEEYGPLYFEEGQEGKYWLADGFVTVTNQGDLPLYISGFNVTIEGGTWGEDQEVHEWGGNQVSAVPPGETENIGGLIFANAMGYGQYEEGTYEAPFRVFRKTTEGDQVISTKTKTVEIGPSPSERIPENNSGGRKSETQASLNLPSGQELKDNKENSKAYIDRFHLFLPKTPIATSWWSTLKFLKQTREKSSFQGDIEKVAKIASSLEKKIDIF